MDSKQDIAKYLEYICLVKDINARSKVFHWAQKSQHHVETRKAWRNDGG